MIHARASWAHGVHAWHDEQRIEHLLRRVGFGGSSDDVSELADVGYRGAVDRLVFHELIADDVDSRIGQAGHVGVTTRSQFLPDPSINDARQRWLFRMVHSRKPLQEKMALFWHHHFATAYSKINGTYGGTLATRMMAATGSYNGANQTPAGQIELFRHEGLGSFYTLLVAIARDPAMLVLYLNGGNDALSTVVPYSNAGDYQRRPTIGVPATSVLQVGTDAGGTNIGLHPRLTGLQQIYNQGRLAIVQRAGYPNSSRSHFLGTDIWSTADPSNPSGPGWLGRYLELLPQPSDPLTAWSTVRETPKTFASRFVGIPAIPDPRTYAFGSPNSGTEAPRAREAAVKIASHIPVDRPHLSFLSGTARSALATLDRVASVAQYQPSVEYPANGLGSALRAVAGAMVRGIGTKVFWVQTGGYDTHASHRTPTSSTARTTGSWRR